MVLYRLVRDESFCSVNYADAVLCERSSDSEVQATYAIKLRRDIRSMGQDSLALRSELSFKHFGTGADMSGQFGPTKPVPGSLRSQLDWVGSVQLPP